ncbi:MAG: Serine-type D-Ala-D-Ala carboxypeptidase [Bacteroidetes bacterium]|nr:Serine-type D-Ala-D-Ala carboxypeptidase [Bacteroidota bacterium]
MKKSDLFKISLLISGMFLFASLRAQTGIDPALATVLQNSINSLRISNNVKGIYAAAYIPGKGTWKGVTGVSYGTVPIDTTMLFSIGSITKTFVASEIFKLIDAGQLSLNDSLYSLLPPMANVDPTITVKQLLGHKSGMSDYLNTDWENAMFADPYRKWYPSEALDSFLTPAAGAPGGTWNYVNANYALLGMIVESQQADSLHHVLRNDFLTPLGLIDTHMEVFENYSSPIPHNWSTPTMSPSLAADSSATPHSALWSSIESAGGYFSNPSDMVHWGYNLYSGTVISPASLSQMLTFTSVSGGYFNGYGLGAMRFVSSGKTFWGHAGNFYGYAACMLYYPADSLCVAVLINQDCIAANIAKPLMTTLINNLSVGVDEQAGEVAVSVFPNPASTSVTVTMPAGTATGQISLYNVVGICVYSDPGGREEFTVNAAELSDGVYILKIQAGNKLINRKIIIQH